MLFNESCKTGQLRVDTRSVKVVSEKRIIWTIPRSKITYIAVKHGVLHADLTIYTATSHFPAHMMTKQHAGQFLALFPGVPQGEPPVVAQPRVYVPPPIASGSQWHAAPTVPFQVPPPVQQTKKKPPIWATVVVIILAIGLCGGISSAVVSAFSHGGAQQAQVAATPTDTPSDTSQSSTLAATVTVDTATQVPTQAPTQAPTAKPTLPPTPKPTPRPVPTQPPAPTPTPCSNPCNPWGYNFSLGSYITSPPSTFCSYFSCIASFWNGHGYVNECQDGEYSLSGGIRGDCSSHGGEMRPLYAH